MSILLRETFDVYPMERDMLFDVYPIERDIRCLSYGERHAL